MSSGDSKENMVDAQQEDEYLPDGSDNTTNTSNIRDELGDTHVPLENTGVEPGENTGVEPHWKIQEWDLKKTGLQMITMEITTAQAMVYVENISATMTT